MIKQIGRSLLYGAATLLDIGGTLGAKQTPLPDKLVDEAAIRSDWETMSADLWWGMDQFSKTPDYQRVKYK